MQTIEAMDNVRVRLQCQLRGSALLLSHTCKRHLLSMSPWLPRSLRYDAIQFSSLQVYKFIWIISGLHVNNKRINNNIHTKIVMALTSCDNTVITYRWKKKESRRTTLNLIRLIAVCLLW